MAPNPARPRSAAPPGAPTRTARGTYVRVLDSTGGVIRHPGSAYLVASYLSNPKPEHTTGGSGRRGSRRGGGARRGGAEQDADVSGGPEPNRQSSPPEYREQLS